jgi:hypothetical protein
VADSHDGWITVNKAFKGKTTSYPVRETKTGKPKLSPGERDRPRVDREEWVVQVPEPAALMILGVGLLAVGARFRRRG